MGHNPTIKLLVGGQNSGKTTWVENVLKPNMEETGIHWRIISHDAIALAYAKQYNIPFMKLFDPENSEISELLDKQYYDAIRNAVSEGMDIVIDDTNTTREDRKLVLDIVTASGKAYEKEALVFKLDADTAIQREQARNRDLEARGELPRNIPEDIIRNRHQIFEDVSKDEGFDRIALASQGHGPKSNAHEIA